MMLDPRLPAPGGSSADPQRRSRAAGATGLLLATAAALMLAHSTALLALPRWELEARLGGAWNIPLPIVLKQEGHDDLRLTARWSTRALRPPLYYAWRIARWRGGHGWALDMTHHKLHLDDPPPEVGSLSISHGYNLVTLQRLEQRAGWRYGAGLGAVVAHPESEIRGRRFDEHRGLFGAGYYLTGPTAGLLVGRSQGLGGPLYATAEAKLTLSFARVPIAGGSARVPNLALHASAGLGWSVSR